MSSFQSRLGMAVAALLALGLSGYAVLRPDPPAAQVQPADGEPAAAASAARVDRPNVLIILWDTVRADRLTVYQPDLPTTPKLAKWAKGAAVFEHVTSPGIWTVPSHASMFTGLPPTTHGTGYQYRWLDGHYTTLAEHFGANGYDTYVFTANPNLSRKRVNLTQGFETVQGSWEPRWRGAVEQNARRKLLPRDRSTEISPAFEGSGTASMYFNAGPVAGRAFLGWLGRRPDPDKPWLAYINYMEAHKPRVPTLSSRKSVATDEQIRLGLQTDMSFSSQLLFSFGQKDYTEAELEAVAKVYDAALRDLDDITAELMRKLGQAGYLDDTIVVLTSDHGEQLGEHHLFGHRHGSYQPLLHIPLIVWWDDRIEPARIERDVTTLDLFWTLNRMVGLPPPDTGLSQRDWFAEEDKGPVYSEMLSIDTLGWQRVLELRPGLDPASNPWNTRLRSVVDGDWKLILGCDGHTELYHLAEDPLETRDRSAAEPERVAAMRTRLEGWASGLERYDPAQRSETDGPPGESESASAQLKMLGYLDPDDQELDDADDCSW